MHVELHGGTRALPRARPDRRARRAGPFVLAGLGADVIKVEPPGGSASRRDGPASPTAAGDWPACASTPSTAASAASCSTSTTPGGRDDFLALVASADFVFENAGAGVDGRRVGSASRRLRDARPDLVYVAISPFGQNGPYAHHLATDLTLAAMGGAMALNGEPDRRPVRITVPQTWHHAAVEGALGALVAHQRRLRDRRGAVRRRLGAGGGLLDRAERDDRPRHPGPEHRAQRHRAAAQHAGHAARLPVRRRRGVPDRHRRHAASG